MPEKRRASKEALKVVVAGMGHAGCRHVENLAALTSLRVVAYRCTDRPLPEQVRHLVEFETNDLAVALATEPAAVLVTNPTSLHSDVALEAARAGCHLFLEKPVSDRLDGILELCSLVRERGLICLVGYNARFRPTLLRVKSWLDEGRVGRVLSVQAQIGEWLPAWHPSEDYRTGVSARRELGGGVILDLSHELDYLPWMVGSVARLSCFAGKVSSLDIETEDLAEILLEFDSGALASVHLDCLQRVPSRTCRILGEDGMICWDGLAPVASLHRYATGETKQFAQPAGERVRSFRFEMEHFLDCILGRTTPSPDLEAGVAALRLAIAAKESSRTGRAVTMERNA